MRKLLVLIIIGFFIGLASAETFQQNAEVDLKHPVRLDEYPDISIACNISVFDPDNIQLVNYSTMTNQLSYHNYTLNPSNTTKLGTYIYDLTCTTGASNKTDSFEFDITVSGKEKLNSGEGISLFISLIVMVLVGIFLLFMASRFESGIPKIIFTTLSIVILFIVILYSIVILTQSFGGFSTFTESYSAFYTVVKVIVSILVLFFILWVGLAALKTYNIKRGLRDE